MEDKKRRRKGVVAAVLSLCLVLVAAAGVVAYLTSTSSLTNTFTVGEGITPPTTDPENPEDPLDPDGDDKDKLSGNLYEKNWVPGTKIAAGQTNIAKDPQVGIGNDSEPCYVFIYVQNNTVTGNAADTGAYFTINGAKWIAAKDGGCVPTSSTVDSNAYVDGLFIYSTDQTSPTKLEVIGDNDAWTGTLFDTVSIPEGATLASPPTIEVSCFLYAPTANETADQALAAAKAWAQEQAQP